MPKYTVKMRNTKEQHEIECDNVLVGERLIEFVDSRGVNFLTNTGEHCHTVAYFPTETVATVAEDGKCKFTAAPPSAPKVPRKVLQAIFDLADMGRLSPSLKKAHDDFMHDYDEIKLLLAVVAEVEVTPQ